MALSDREKEVLAQMEAQLRGEDPVLVDSLAGSKDDAATPRLKAGPRAWAVAISIAVVGLVLLVVGVSIHIRWVGTLVGISGFLLMLGGLLLPFSERVVRMLGGPNKLAKTPPARRNKKSGSFMERQANKWDERHQR